MASEYVQRLATTLIEQLKQGTAPWIKPWKPGSRFMPYNPVSGNAYHGMNAVWLLAQSQQCGYRDARWMTYRQAQAQGAQVRRGERGTLIQYWKWEGLEPVLDAQGNPVLNKEGQPQKAWVRYERPRIFSAVVFNAAQIEGLPEAEAREALPEWERHARAEAILKDSGAQIQHEHGERAYYSLLQDRIILPVRAQFLSPDGYYATALHELGHWSGHPSRLNRDLAHPFGSEGYAREELRAEIASLILGEQLSIGHDPGNHLAYIGSWIRVLEEDPREIFRAAADAERIVRYIRGLEQQQEPVLSQELQNMPVGVVEREVAMWTSEERVYLVVPYAEKNEAKALGARWDREAKTWFVPPGVDPTPFERWRLDRRELHLEVSRDPRAEFASALQAAGLKPEGLPWMDSRLHRVPVEGDKPGERSGAYVGFLNGHPAGYLRNYKTGVETTWKSRNRTQALNPEDRKRLLREAAERQESRLREQNRKCEETARALEAQWASAHPVTTHPYLTEKSVPAYGLRQDEAGHLLIPVRDADGKLWSLQRVDAQGRKSFVKDSRVHGGHHWIGDPCTSCAILVVEGYATGATVHQATGLAVAIAFHAGNLAPVARALHERYPDQPLYIAGDNDHQREQKGKPNVGREKAEEAAREIGVHWVVPQFTPTDPGSDWNDLARSSGMEEVRSQLERAMAMVRRPKQTTQPPSPTSLIRGNELEASRSPQRHGKRSL